MANNEGTPLHGDRGAYDTISHADEHARDINDATLKRHLPAPSAAGTYARDDGTNWVAQLGILLADLLGYARGSILRGGASDWEAYDASSARYVLVGDGTDIVSRALVNADLPDPLAFVNAATTLTIRAGSVSATQNLHIIAAETGTTDDLDTINGLTDRQWLLLKADTGDTITVKHGTGNIHFDSGIDFELSGDSWLLLFYDGTNAVALGAGGAGVSDAADVTYTPTTLTDWDSDSDPGDVDDSLDQLAERVDDNEEITARVPTAPVGLIFSQVVDVTVANTTDETTLLGAGRGSKTISGGIVDVGTTIRISLSGHLSDSGAPTLNIKVYLGSTEVCVTGAITLNNTVSQVDWHLDVLLTVRDTGAAGTVVGSGLFDHDSGASFGLVNTSEVSVDWTADQQIDIKATWGTADAGNTQTCQEATIELMKADNLAVAAPNGLTATETV